MNKLLRKLFLYASLGALVFVACSEDEGDLDPGTGPARLTRRVWRIRLPLQ